MPALDYDVVIPTHGKNFALLLEAIDSVLAQTVPAKAVIVVVDGVPEAAARLRAERPDVRIVTLDSPSGEGAARQRGIEEATAEWVCFLDDDDLWPSQKQSRFAAYVDDHPECEAVCAGYWTFTARTGAAGGINGQVPEVHGDSLRDLEDRARRALPLNDLDYLDIFGRSADCLLEYNRGNIGTAMVRREVLLQGPQVPGGIRPGADHLLFCAVASHTEWHLIKERLLFYRLHEGQDTRRQDPDGARNILTSLRLAWSWLAGRTTRPLPDFGPLYRRDVRRLVWPLVAKREWRAALSTYREAKGLLPRRRDRLLVLVPEPLVWRVRYRLLRPVTTREAQRSPSW